MTTSPIPYIGVAGVTTRAQADFVGRPGQSHRPVMLGVLVSPLTLQNQVPRLYPRRYTKGREVAGIFGEDPHVINSVHLGGCHPGNVFEDLREAEAAGGTRLDAVQLNSQYWPDRQAIADWHDMKRVGRFRPLFVLQVSSAMMLTAGRCPPWLRSLPARSPWVRLVSALFIRPRLIAQRLAAYGPLVNHALIDGSSGQGVPINVGRTQRIARAIRDEPELADVGVTVGGGLGPHKVARLAPLVDDLDGAVSFDAEHNLRCPTSDEFNLWAASRFLEESYSLFHERAKRKKAAGLQPHVTAATA